METLDCKTKNEYPLMEEENPLSNEIILNTGAQQACFYFLFFNLQYYSRCTPMNDDTARQLF